MHRRHSRGTCARAIPPIGVRRATICCLFAAAGSSPAGPGRDFCFAIPPRIEYNVAKSVISITRGGRWCIAR